MAFMNIDKVSVLFDVNNGSIGLSLPQMNKENFKVKFSASLAIIATFRLSSDWCRFLVVVF